MTGAVRSVILTSMLGLVGCSGTPATVADSTKAEPPPAKEPTPPGPSEPAPTLTKPALALPHTVDLTVGERIPVAEEIDVTFLGNGHKIMERGESPLGISLMVHRDNRDIDTSEWVAIPGEVKFTAAGVTFEYVTHHYSKSIRLIVLSVAPLEQ